MSSGFRKFGCGCGAALAALVGFMAIYALFFAPPLGVVSHEGLRAKDLEVLEKLKLLDEGEKIIYFYTQGVLSIREDGNFYTDRKVVSFKSDGDDGMYIETAGYDEIEELQPEFSTSWLEESTVTVSRNDGSDFVLYMSPDEKESRKFYNRLLEEWKAHAGEPSRSPMPKSDF